MLTVEAEWVAWLAASVGCIVKFLSPTWLLQCEAGVAYNIVIVGTSKHTGFQGTKGSRAYLVATRVIEVQTIWTLSTANSIIAESANGTAIHTTALVVY